MLFPLSPVWKETDAPLAECHDPLLVSLRLDKARELSRRVRPSRVPAWTFARRRSGRPVHPQPLDAERTGTSAVTAGVRVGARRAGRREDEAHLGPRRVEDLGEELRWKSVSVHPIRSLSA